MAGGFTGRAVHPELRRIVQLDILRELVEAGIDARVTSGHRSIARQRQLYRAHLRGGPLAAPPGKSAHNYGLAVDIALPGVDPSSFFGWRKYRKLHAIAERWGLVTLDGAQRREDPYHLEWPDWRGYAASHPSTARAYARWNV
jgi:LAS superfamily LD-carboxypeptidase LdcB